MKSEPKTFFIIGGLVVVFFVVAWFGLPSVFSVTYISGTLEPDSNGAVSIASNTDLGIKKNVPIRMKTPEPLKAIYMTQCVAGTPSFREQLVKVAETTEINSIIIDIKDFSGGLGFIPENPELAKYLSSRCYAPDMKDFVRSLNEKGIYVIARITVFQDPIYAMDHPEIAVQKASTKEVWSDFKGIHFIDPGAKEFWKYIVDISKEAYDLGFDELNFDYIRYPSDGPMKDIYYPKSGEKIAASQMGKALVIKDFFEYLHKEMEEIGVVTSADLFGMTTTNRDDLNIGQILEYALPYFDFVAPMVYPSHYPKGFNGWENPNHYPYEIVKFAMSSAAARAEEMRTSTTTPDWIREKVSPLQLRTWIQDFNYGGNYGVPEIKAQIKATYDSGLTSWMVWSPSNRYTIGALEKE